MNSTEPTAVSARKNEVTERDEDEPYRDRFLTIPNIICVIRILGSLSLIWLAVAGYGRTFVGVFVALSLSDWIDGRLARWLHQRSDFGARLDSASDSILYACLLIGSLILKWDVLGHELAWIGAALASYSLTTGYGLWKYGKVPSYHTYGAKKSQWLVLAGTILMLLDVSIWPMRIAALAVTLTNLEATAMTWYLPEWTADVLSLFHVRAARDRAQNSKTAR